MWRWAAASSAQSKAVVQTDCRNGQNNNIHNTCTTRDTLPSITTTRVNNNMGELSRASSRRPMLAPQDDTDSLTSFPDPPPASPTTAPSPTMAEHMYGLLDRSEPTMFDERPAVNTDDPRALSAADSAVLQGVLDHHGAINLVKRLSEALAERDAHITALQRLCEEYKVPKDRITDAASRVKQAERRRLSLSAASEDLAPSGGTQSESSVCFILYQS